MTECVNECLDEFRTRLCNSSTRDSGDDHVIWIDDGVGDAASCRQASAHQAGKQKTKGKGEKWKRSGKDKTRGDSSFCAT